MYEYKKDKNFKITFDEVTNQELITEALQTEPFTDSVLAINLNPKNNTK